MNTKQKQAIEKGEDASVNFLNYKADGTPFWNQFFVAALRDSNNRIVNFVGAQCPVPGPLPPPTIKKPATSTASATEVHDDRATCTSGEGGDVDGPSTGVDGPSGVGQSAQETTGTDEDSERVGGASPRNGKSVGTESHPAAAIVDSAAADGKDETCGASSIKTAEQGDDVSGAAAVLPAAAAPAEEPSDTIKGDFCPATVVTAVAAVGKSGRAGAVTALKGGLPGDVGRIMGKEESLLSPTGSVETPQAVKQR